MARFVHCVRLEKEAEGLGAPPLPGPKGQWIYENVSREAWQQWTAHQTRLINEKQLVLKDAEARAYLVEQMDKFFRRQDFDQAEGYVPAAPAAALSALIVDAASQPAQSPASTQKEQSDRTIK